MTRFQKPEEPKKLRGGTAGTAAIRTFEIESRTRAPSVVERGGFEPPKAEPADLQSAPFDRFGTSPVRQCSLNSKNTHRTTPHSRSCPVLSPPHPRTGRLPAIGCECRMSNCCLFLSARPTCVFRSRLCVANLCLDATLITFDFAERLRPRPGAGDGTRTRNLLITNQLLCQLSYASQKAIER